MIALWRALQARSAEHPALPRFREIARILTGHTEATAGDGIGWVRETCQALNIPPLRPYEISASDFPDWIEKAAQASSMKANPIPLTPPEMEEILQRA